MKKYIKGIDHYYSVNDMIVNCMNLLIFAVTGFAYQFIMLLATFIVLFGFSVTVVLYAMQFLTNN